MPTNEDTRALFEMGVLARCSDAEGNINHTALEEHFELMRQDARD